MLLLRSKKVDFLEIARGGVGGRGHTCWGGGRNGAGNVQKIEMLATKSGPVEGTGREGPKIASKK